jgi:hypothetical protein
MSRGLSIAVALLAVAGCGSDVVPCADDTRCVRAAVHGRCAASPVSASHFCIFADAACADGQRWDKTAGDGLAQACVGTSGTPLGAGAPCSGGSQCGTGICVDGVCCDRDCSGDACYACNLEGSVGKCAAVADGAKPAGGHPSCAASSCAAASNTFTPAGQCDGAGHCATPAAIPCAPYVCKDAGSCFDACTGNGQCAGNNSCVDGSCGPKANAALCTSDGECASGHCAQGVCCDDKCDGTCKSCSLAATRGRCSFVAAGQPDPQGGCKPGSGADAACAPGGCDGSGACGVAPASTVCRGASCDAGTNQYSPPTSCGGSATCPAPAATACTAYKCAGTACGTSCNLDGDCLAGYYCSGHACVGKYAGGTVCTADNQCGTGICSPQQTDCHGVPLGPTKVCCVVRCTNGGCCGCDSTGMRDNGYEIRCSNVCM